MLADKRKTNARKKKALRDKTPSEDTVQSFRSWIRKLDQTANSLSSRLSAVEKRLSRRKLDSSANLTPGNMVEGNMGRIFEILKGGTENKNFDEVSRILDSEFTIMQEELISQQTEVAFLKEKIGEVSSSLDIINGEIKEGHIYNSKFLKGVESRLEKIERREPPVMKLGRMEIPIEITGVIGGIIAFIAAIIIAMGQKEIIVSPLFLLLVGFILIGSALFKAFSVGSVIVRPFKKTSEIPSKIEDGS